MRGLGTVAVVLALVALTAGCGQGGGGASTAGSTADSTARMTTTTAARTDPKLADLHDIGQLRTLFNRHAGEPRLILLMSPT